MNIYHLTFVLLLRKTIELVTVAPIWQTSSLVKANSFKVINQALSPISVTPIRPSATIPFPNSAFTAPPNVAYGVSQYEGDDTLRNQKFQILRIGLTATALSVQIILQGTTSIWILEIRCISVDPTFPHHINSFENVPVNYNNGPLMNITSPSPTLSYYRNVVNYTTQASLIGSSHTAFPLPLSSNKILLFMSSLFIEGAENSTGLGPFTVYQLAVTATPLTTDTYLFEAQFGVDAKVERLHFSMIIFNEAEVEATGKYFLMYEKVNFPAGGGTYPFPAAFEQNFLIGLLDFNSWRKSVVLKVLLQIGPLSASSFGVYMPSSVPRNPAFPTLLTRYGFNVFYMKTWLCPDQYFLSHSINLCVKCQLANCVNCSSLTTCYECNVSNNYLVNSTTKTCSSCLTTGCLSCSAFNECLVCDDPNQYFLNLTTNLCQPCLLEGCIYCQTINICQVCNLTDQYGLDFTAPGQCGKCNVSCVCDGYVMPWNIPLQRCSSLCGDGLIRIEEVCDDGNILDEDGCSSACEVERFYNCTDEPSNCTLTLHVRAQFVDVVKTGCNEMLIKAKLIDYRLEEIQKFLRVSILNPEVSIISSQQKQGYFWISAEYYRDIYNETLMVHFAPGEIISFVYNPIIPPLSYSPQQCRSAAEVSKMLQAIEIISYVLLGISLISCKIVGIELFGVLQLAYYSLASHDFLNIYMHPLAKFSVFNGLNPLLFPQPTQQLPVIIAEMEVRPNFLNSCNVMMFLQLAVLLLGVVLFIISKCTQQFRLYQISRQMLKQALITIVMFNSLNVAFSTGVHFKYADQHSGLFIGGSLVSIIAFLMAFGAIVGMNVTSSTGYGEYRDKFKDSEPSRSYIIISILYRIALGLCLAVGSERIETTLVILSFSLGFLLYNVINLPFLDPYQNYRSHLVHLIMCYILVVANYYRSLQHHTAMEIKGRIFEPALLELVMLIVCIGISAVALVYEIYKEVKKWRHRRVMDSKYGKAEDTEDSMANIT